MIMSELSNCNVRFYKISRKNFNDLFVRADSNYSGICLFIDDTNYEVYIEKSENLFSSLKKHSYDYFEWNVCLILLDKNNEFTKSELGYIEYNLYNLFKMNTDIKLVNDFVPSETVVSEFDKVMLDEFIENSKMLLNVFGYGIFNSSKKNSYIKNESYSSKVKMNTESKPEIKTYDDGTLLYIKKRTGVEAVGKVVPEGFCVLAGSTMSDIEWDSQKDIYGQIKKKLQMEGILDGVTFVKDYVFTSASQASSFIEGYSTNGKLSWKNDKGVKLKDL